MPIDKPVMTKEMRSFGEQGFANYAPALVARSEFRRQVRTKLQVVLEDFSPQLTKLGLSPDDVRSDDPKLDDPGLNETASWIGLRKNHGAEIYTGYHLQWDLDEETDEQVWVGAWVYIPSKGGRNRLFHSLQEHHGKQTKTDLTQYSDHAAWLSAYCKPDGFDESFRSLIEE